MRNDVVVQTSNGAVRGVADTAVAVFHAVPYAAPPVGPLRFAAPQPVISWAGVRDCTQVGPSPPQGPSRLDAVMGLAAFAQSEDCLALTIWSPSPTVRGGKACPVLFWLHGGAYQSGGGDQPFYSSDCLARAGDVVVVSINYRLGALGYLYLPEIEAAGGAPACRGLLDQMQALRWVADNIASFGGDPARITIAGQSAGAGSVLALLADPSSRRLVRNAIAQSPSVSVLSPRRATEIAERFYAASGVPRGDVAGLRALPLSAVLAAQRAVQIEIAATGDRTLPFQNVAPTPPCPQPPADALATGAAADISLLIGSTLDEGHAWLAQDDRLLAATSFDVIDPRLAKAAADLPDARRAAARKPWQLLSAMLTWATFEKPARALAERHAANGGAAFVYRFDWRPTPDARFGACHCIELPFIFGNLAGWPPSPMLAGHDPASSDRLASSMQRAWISFIHSGRPSAPDWPEWPSWSTADKPCMIFDDPPKLVTGL